MGDRPSQEFPRIPIESQGVGGDLPLRKDATKFVKPEILPNLPTAPENTTNWFKSDTQFWADNQEALTERFNVWISK